MQFPVARPGVVSGAVLASRGDSVEFGATAMIAGNISGKTRTLPLAVYAAVASGDTREAAGYVAVLIGISFLVVIMMNYVSMRAPAGTAVLPQRLRGKTEDIKAGKNNGNSSVISENN